METVIGWIGSVLGVVMDWCYQLCGNYGWAIILFTLLSKVFLLPLSIWVHLNGLKMVRMMPEINWLHVNHYGDPDAIADGQAALYKKEKYNPLISLVPVVIQLILLLGMIEVIRRLLANGNGPETVFFGLNLGWVPAEKGGISLIVPFLAALSALAMCVTQNIAQPLQSEQSKLNKWTMLIVSVGLSLYLGFFVATGIGIYWTASNLFSIALMYLLNWLIPPEKYVDYEALEKSREALQAIEALGPEKKGLFVRDENAKREKKDYKRFFSVRNKHVVFYSEKSGFWKYFRAIVEELLKRSNLRIHYITNDPNDQIFGIAEKEPRIIPYYIGPKKIIPLMMKMDADLVVMTTPDLESFHIKRSYIRKDIEYIYTPHDPLSVHMGFRKEALDHFDTIFCQGPQQVEEIKKAEEVYGLPKKNLILCGYSLLDTMRADWQQRKKEPKSGRVQILIAPTWNEDNILDSCVDELLQNLMADNRKITVRPHPEYVKRFGARMSALENRWKDQVGEGLRFETDFSSNESIYDADILITDWSSIAYEYSYTTGKPSLFINTKMKVLNPDWERLGITPMDIALRDQIGRSLNKDELDQADAVIAEMSEHPREWAERIDQVRLKYVAHPGESGKIAAEYIISRLVNRQNP